MMGTMTDSAKGLNSMLQSYAEKDWANNRTLIVLVMWESHE